MGRMKKANIAPESRRKSEHFKQLAEIAEVIIEDDLDQITEKPGKPGQYHISHKNNEVEELIRDELVYLLEGNMDIAMTLFGSDLWHSFESHMKAENHDIESWGLKGAAASHPIQLVALLKQIVETKTFKGDCPICQDWR
jgi:hypothetical protein